jgi:hypothetical protein
MIIDGALQFSGTAGTISTDSPTTGTQFSNNVLDLLNARDLGVGDDPAMKVLAEVITTFTGGTSLQIAVQGSVDNVTYVTMVTGPAVLEANLVPGTYLGNFDLPRIAGPFPDHPGPTQPLPRYLRLAYVSVGTHGAGALFASLVLDRLDQISYPPGIIINN